MKQILSTEKELEELVKFEKKGIKSILTLVF